MINENKLLALIEKVCNQPKKYTHNGTFKEVLAFIEKKGRSAIEGTFYFHSIFTPFLRWYVKKTENGMMIDMKNFQNSFSSKDEALKSFPVLYKEYIQDL